MNLSPDQDRAVAAVRRWLDHPTNPVFRLFGYAGTGKTTLATLLASEAKGRVLFAAYTGKAASVMRSRGCADATTLHRLIYTSASKSTQRLVELEKQLEELLLKLPEDHPDVRSLKYVILEEKNRVKSPSFRLNPDSEVRSASLVVIDECSMVDDRMGNDLLSFGKKVLVLGDPAQLPPVRGEGFFTSQRPDVVLTQIHRQAEGNPIIELATRIRSGEDLPYGTWGDTSVVEREAFTRTLVSTADQVIVGRNATRRLFNSNYRSRVMGFKTPLPCVADKLVCLRNNHDIGVLNGEVWAVRETQSPSDSKIELTLERGEEDCVSLTAHQAPFLGEEINWWERADAEEFDYGYALTCHKAQGSQWDRVVVNDESSCFREHATRWLYTAVTRAAKSVVVVK